MPIEESTYHPVTADNIDHWERDTLEQLDKIAASVRRQAIDLRHHLEGMQYLLNQLDLASAAAKFNHDKGVSQ